MRYQKMLRVFVALCLVLALAGCNAADQAPSPEEETVASSEAPASVPEEKEEPPSISVRYLEGEVTCLRDGETLALAMDTLLVQGDEVKTAGDGMAVLKLDGDKQVQIAPDSHVEIAGFERGEDGDKTLLILHGGNIINVLDQPLKDTDSYEVETPSLVMAIRGTIASVSSDAESGQARVLLFEGHSMVNTLSGSAGAEISAGGYAWTVDDLLEHRAFTGADLTLNEYWFLYEADHSDLFDEPGAKIADRLKPLLDGQGYQEEAAADGQRGGSPTAPANAEPDGVDEDTLPDDDARANDAPPAKEPSPPAAETPPASPPPAANDPPPAQGGGMDEATFRAIEQEFLQAKEDYNNGLIGKDEFLAIKQRYIDAKKLYYGE